MRCDRTGWNNKTSTIAFEKYFEDISYILVGHAITFIILLAIVMFPIKLIFFVNVSTRQESFANTPINLLTKLV